MIASLRYLTDDIPGIGGELKVQPEDFIVEELPLYEPRGSGEHLYLFIEKRQRTTTDVARRIARAFHVKRKDVGYAGMKDKRAGTRQRFSVHLPPDRDSEKGLERLAEAPFKLLWSDWHGNKLRRGHLTANRFDIRVRNVEPTAALRAREILKRLEARGVPNFVGHQRFGYRQQNHELGRLLLLGEHQRMLDLMLGDPIESETEDMRAARRAYDQGDYPEALKLWSKRLRPDRQALEALRQGKPPATAAAAIDSEHRDFLISGLQSAVFNRVLDDRVAAGTFDRLLPGDVAWLHGSRSVFAVDEATAELENGPQGRVASFDVSPSGPMWGPKMPRASGEVGQLEQQALHSFGLNVEQIAASPEAPGGLRRPLRVPMIGAEVTGGVDERGAFVRVGFDLARGSFATTVLREIMKTDVDDSDDDEEEEDAT